MVYTSYDSSKPFTKSPFCSKDKTLGFLIDYRALHDLSDGPPYCPVPGSCSLATCPSCTLVMHPHRSLCMGCSLCLVPSFPDLQIAPSLISFEVLFKTHFLKIYPDSPIKKYKQMVNNIFFILFFLMATFLLQFTFNIIVY